MMALRVTGWDWRSTALASGLAGLLLGLMLACPLAQPLMAQSSAARAQRVAHSRHAKAKSPAVSKAQKELAQEMLHDAYELGRGLALRQRVELMRRLLYTMRPEVMAAEKQEWAEELFRLARLAPVEGAESGNAAEAQPLPAAGAWAGSEAAWRSGAIATAAARVAVYDSTRALELLDKLPSEGGRRPDARCMAARLVFASYLQHHGSEGAETLLSYGRKWGEHGGFPYLASATALGRLRLDEDAAEDFFRQILVAFERGQEGVYGVREFAGLLDRAVAMESISEESADEAGRAVVLQLRKLAASGSTEITEEEQGEVARALTDVRLTSPKAYEQARREAPELLTLRPPKVVAHVETPKVDSGLQAAFRELADDLRTHRSPEELRAAIGRGLQLVNARYKSADRPGGLGAEDSYGLSHSGQGRLAPDAQSWALVSLAAYAAPMTIGLQLGTIQDPFWRAYFTAIAAGQVGEPTRVGDPTARRIPGKEEAEPE